MDYPQWEHESRDPRDRVVAPPPWSAAGQADDDQYFYDDDEPSQRYVSEYGWNRGDRGDRGDRGQRRSSPSDATGEWVAVQYPDSWQTGTGWVQSQHQRPDDSGYLTDPRYGSGYPDEDPPPYGGGHRVFDHDDWYESPTGRGLPAPRQRASMTPRPPPAHVRRREDEDGEVAGLGSLPVALSTVIWYVAPVVLYVLWALMLGGTPEPNCVDPAGNPCGAPRTEALNKLVDSLPQLTTAVGLSLVIALVIRWFNATWRAATIGFAAAVVGAGIATAIFSMVGRPTLG